MRAYRLQGFTGFDDLRVTDEAMPDVGPDEVLVRVEAASLNFRDIAMATQQYPPAHLPGLIPLSDAAGEVVGVGDRVSALTIGDRVVNTFHPRWFGGRQPDDQARDQYGSQRDGWLTEYKAVSQESVVAIPEHLSFAEAATLPCAAVTAWTALRGGNPVGPGQTVLTLGTGGVSLFAVQLAKLAGATVIATTSNAVKAEVLRDLGADHVIDYNQTASWGEAARDLTGGRGVDRVVEIGGAGTFPQSMTAVAPGGEVSVIGFVDSSARATVDFTHFFLSGATFRILNVGDRSALQEVVASLDRSRLKPTVDSIYSFNDAVDAYRRLASGDAVGKVIVSIGGE